MGTEKVMPARSFYEGILHPESGKLLVYRRTSITSIIPNVSFRGNWELIGGAVMTSDAESVSYHYYLGELCRHLEEKTGIVMAIRGLPVMHTLLFKGKDGKYDESSVIPMVQDVTPTKGETLWVSPYELRTLADEFEPADEKTGKSGKGLVSGYGKRMHCMGLCALTHSPNYDFSVEAIRMLQEILP